MMRFLIVMVFSFLLTVTLAQKRPIEVRKAKDFDNRCSHIALGSGFEKSGMDQYVARPRVIQSSWKGNTLKIKIFVVSECCPPDYLGFEERADTLILYYGNKENLPEKDGKRREEFQICTCGYTGCCYEFEYEIRKLDYKKNYLVAISDVSWIGWIGPHAVDYLDKTKKSIHYSSQCLNPQACLDGRIEEAMAHYKKLRPLYTQLLEEILNENELKEVTLKMIKKEWLEYFKLRQAISDDYIRAKMSLTLYHSKIAEFEKQIESELNYLEPILDRVKEHIQGGAFVESVKELKVLDKH